ncbi:HAD family hydrolase [Actinocorallia populi]|uniref:HAD family hydrolase n=1 Tax=Actinocorallia populi TaxID=2079200 RepID=UPI000D08AB95|nr:HAD family phosphatase [Actinocorallia populi]
MTLQAILFDLDGTLINSEPVWLAVEHEVMQWLGGPWDVEHQNAVVGGALWSTVDYMLALAGSSVPREAVAERLLGLMAERLPTELAVMPGAKELLTEAAAEGVPIALVTSTVRSLADVAIDALGRHHFTLTVAGDEVEYTKPHPEPYLKAARLLGADPARCVALEDSLTGVKAAEAAGCAVVAIPCVVPVEHAPTRTVLPSMEGLTVERLRSLIVGP